MSRPCSPIPATPPQLLAGPAYAECLWGATKWLVAIGVCALLCTVALLTLPSPIADPIILVGVVAGILCGIPAFAGALRSMEASRAEHAAGYTTGFGESTRYWQLEPGTGKVLRRPGERTVHREGIPRELLAQEAAARVSASGAPSSVQAPSVGPYRCPVCGYPDLAAPPRSDDGGGSYEICWSCGFEFGVSDDDLGYTYQGWRQRWIERGMPWDSAALRPPPLGWDPGLQLRQLREGKSIDRQART